MAQPVFRFAPSPNGLLHLGHAFSALLNEALARRLDGRLLLRIENIDPLRSRSEYEAAILDDLAWLGIRWEQPVLRQSGEMARYASALQALRDRGLVYRCFCSRTETHRLVAAHEERGAPWPRDPDGAPLHAGPCASLGHAEAEARAAAGEPHAWRLAMDPAVGIIGGPLRFSAFEPDGMKATIAAQPQRWGDVIVARRDVPTSYHLSVVLDDALQGVTHVVRGADLLAATDVHRVLQELLGLPAPLYHHHALLLDENGRKLAKSESATPLRSLRAAGVSPSEVRRRLGFEAAPHETEPG
jgi:glutamyl-Q tRNA(Asp) synthetase